MRRLFNAEDAAGNGQDAEKGFIESSAISPFVLCDLCVKEPS
jgi:hypothetical protein